MTADRCSRVLLATLFCLLATGASSPAGGVYNTKDFADVVDAVHAAIAEHGAQHVLLVCDIDNTLLAVDGDLGSDQWFEWQSYLLKQQPDSPRLVAEDFDGLLAAQGLLFTLGKMHPPQPEIPDQIATLQKTGLHTLVLTSRGDVFRGQTERELRANGYDFATSAMHVNEQACGVYLPYDPRDFEASGLTAAEAASFRLPDEPKGVSYAEGVFMAAGQHKGAMLLTMLARSPQDFKAVVFVDDHGRHVLRVFGALTGRGIDATVLHYQHEDDRVSRFRYSDKRGVDGQWRRLDKTLDAVFH